MAFTALMIMFVDIMLVPALPYITMDFPEHSQWVSWILSVYLLVGAVMNPIVGKLADIYGKKRMLMITFSIYSAGLIGCALSYSEFELLILFRALQGIGLTMFPVFYGIIRDTFPSDKVPTAIGIVSAMFSVGVSVGLLGGGWIVSAFDWEYCYYIVAPLFLLLIPVMFFKIKDAGVFVEGRKVDTIGAATLGGSVLALLLAMTLLEDSSISDPAVILCFALFAVLMASFVIMERRTEDPLVKLGLLTGNGAGAHVSAFLFGISMFMLFQTLPYLLMASESVGGFGIDDTFDIGLIMIPMAVMGMIFGPMAGKWCRKEGMSIKVLAAGMAMFAAGDVLLIFMHGELWMIVMSMCISGAGNALAMVSMINVVVETSPAEDFGVSSGMNTMFRLIGGSVGPVLGTMILSGYALDGLLAYDIDGYVMTWIAGALFCAIGCISAYMLKPESGRL